MTVALVWFRQDLRCGDNPAFATAVNEHEWVIPLYILDKTTIPLGEAQQWWLHHSLQSLDKALEQQCNLRLLLRQGSAAEILLQLVNQYGVDTVYWNRCYEPLAIKRDSMIKVTLKAAGISVKSSNGSLLNEPWTINNKSGDYYKVFTPYWRHCFHHMAVPKPQIILRRPAVVNAVNEHLDDWQLLPKNPNWASAFPNYWEPGEQGAQKKLDEFIHSHLMNYKADRNLPAKDATSKLSPHLHFGEISPWQIWRALEEILLDTGRSLSSPEHFLSELGWREFSYHLLYHVPELPHKNFKSAFDAFPWQVDAVKLKRWQQGLTGFPLVDAGMRELWQTGYMHNRVRMIVASFLTKDLFIDWRIGAAWFWNTLVDADLANNTASWQWVAGCGADAAPYFRIFNPVLQSKTFDSQGEYIRRWVPELRPVADKWIHQPSEAPEKELGVCLGEDYPYPIIEHDKSRQQALLYYQQIKDKAASLEASKQGD